MFIELKRRYLGEQYTIGSLFINNEYFSDTIEDQVRDYNKDGDLADAGEAKVFGETAIPYGYYRIDLTMSPRFERLLPMILNVPYFTGIRIHRGNTAMDTHGCILPGENKVKGKVINSTKYEMLLVEMILKTLQKGQIVTIRIT